MQGNGTPLDPNMQQILSMLGELRSQNKVILELLFKVSADRLEDRILVDRLARRQASTDHQVALMSSTFPQVPNWEPERTGQHDVAALHRAKAELEQLRDRVDGVEGEVKAEEERKRNSILGWRNAWRTALIGGFVALLVASIGGCAGWAVHEFVTPRVAPPAAPAK